MKRPSCKKAAKQALSKGNTSEPFLTKSTTIGTTLFHSSDKTMTTLANTIDTGCQGSSPPAIQSNEAPSGFILKLFQMVNGAPDEVIAVRCSLSEAIHWRRRVWSFSVFQVFMLHF
jgi:hypothetical protein